MRQAKHLAARTVNAFTGATEWSHSLMTYALAGNRSYVSSDTFWFIFPYHLVSFVQDALNGRAAQEEEVPDACLAESAVQDQIDVLIEEANTEDSSHATRDAVPSNSGARMYKLGGEIILVSQAESYRHRGTFFEAYSALEFEMIVDILPRTTGQENDTPRRGRPKRRGFDLPPGHPLSPAFQGFIRTKFRTAMLGGPPPPHLAKDGQAPASLSQYLLSMVLPWNIETGVPDAELNPDGLVNLCREWNRSTASFVNRQRYHFVENLLQKGHRCARNEKACSEWRSRDAAFWADSMHEHPLEEPPYSGVGPDQTSSDHVADGTLATQAELYALTSAAAAKDLASIENARAMRATFWSLFPPDLRCEASPTDNEASSPIYDAHLAASVSLSAMARTIHSMSPLANSQNITTGTTTTTQTRGPTPADPYAMDPLRCAERHRCSADQRKVFDRIIGSIEPNGRLRQTLTTLHGGGGTGKSALIRAIVNVLQRHQIDTVSTCPTGIGASHLKNGRTFHSAFKTFRKGDLSENDLALLRLTFTSRVQLIVVDEMSMLSAEFMNLLDTRLRQIYRNNLRFGGRSVLLVRHGSASCFVVTLEIPLIIVSYRLATFCNWMSPWGLRCAKYCTWLRIRTSCCRRGPCFARLLYTSSNTSTAHLDAPFSRPIWQNFGCS